MAHLGKDQIIRSAIGKRKPLCDHMLRRFAPARNEGPAGSVDGLKQRTPRKMGPAYPSDAWPSAYGTHGQVHTGSPEGTPVNSQGRQPLESG